MTIKTNLFSTLLVCTSLFLTSCAIDGHEPDEPITKAEDPSLSITPSKEVLRSFDIKFPHAKDIEWSVDGSYYVADFTEFSSATNAWFEQEGNWVSSKSSLTSSELNKEIHNAFLNSIYSTNQLISRNRLERKDLGDVYMIETNNGAHNINIYYTENGDFIKTVKNYGDYVDRPVEVSEKVNNMVTSHFTAAEILDVWEDSLSPKVGVMENDTYKVATLNSEYDWVSTIWVVEEATVPEVVMNSFKTSPYGSVELNSIRIMENSSDRSYLFYFFEGGKNKIATLMASGLFISIISY
ncbi:MAG: PepSY-like domain-containing protein [Tannerellaceae bacterium]|jgi:hypothetical protein|nr:PepSY-like domain-containing protein [Tannerellaceae bacterium]